MSLNSTDPQPLRLKPTLSIKKGIESLSMKKTITFGSDMHNDDMNMSISSSALKKMKKKPKRQSTKEKLAQIAPKYLSNSTISTLAKLEIDKRFKVNEEEIQKK